MADENVIIVGKLESSELQKSIESLVTAVENGVNRMADSTESAITEMQKMFSSLGGSLGSLPSMMQENTQAIREQTQAINDAVVAYDKLSKAAHSAATNTSSVGNGGVGNDDGNVAPADNTVGGLRATIKDSEKARNEMTLYSQELQRQNELIAAQKKLLEEQLATEEELRKKEEQRLAAEERAAKRESKRLQEPYLEQKRLSSNLSENDINQVTHKLQEMKKVRDDMVNSGLFKPSEIQAVIKQIDRLQAKLDKMRQSKQPIQNLTMPQALQLEEKTLDQIAYKMKEIARLRGGVAINSKEFNALDGEYKRLSQRQSELLGKNARLEKSNKSLARSFEYIKRRVAYTLTVGALTGFVNQLIEVRAQYELLERSIGVLFDDMERGTEIFNELNEMAIKSPFTLIELGTAAKQLAAYNFSQEEVVDTTRRLADISAALAVPLERLVYNLGQIKAQGVLNARDARDFANAGFAIVPMLAEMYTKQKLYGDEVVKTSDVYSMMSKKMVSYRDVLSVIQQQTGEGGKFFDFQAKQAETLKVQIANLTLAWNNMLNEIGKENQGVLTWGIKALKTMLQNWRSIESAISSVVVAFGVYKAALLSASIYTRIVSWGAAFARLARMVGTAGAAVVLFRRTVASIGPGLIIGLIAIASYFAFFRKKTEEASEAVTLFGEKAADMLNKVENLTTIMDALDESSGAYKKAMSELNTILEEYGIGQITEKDNIEQINEKRRELIELIRMEGMEREYANQRSKGQEDFKTATDNARKDAEERFKDWYKRTRIEDDFVRENASAISTILEDVTSQNVNLIIGKSGEELEKGYEKITQELAKRISGITYKGGVTDFLDPKKFPINNLTYMVQQFAEEYAKATEALRVHNAIADNTRRIAEKQINASKSAASATLLYQRRLQAASADTYKLYDKISQIVRDYAKAHNIDFNVRFSAKVPDWMLRMNIDELKQLAGRFTAVGQAGRHIRGYSDAESTLARGFLYAEAARMKQENADRNALSRSTNKVAKSTAGARHQEDLLAKALKDELQIIERVRANYDKLRKAGVSDTEALRMATNGYDKALQSVNAQLKKLGLNSFSLDSFAGKDISTLLSVLETQLQALIRSGKAKQASIKDFVLFIEKLRVDAKVYEFSKITETLNSEFEKLKTEYELGIELDASPEIGNLFAQVLGLSEEDLANLPRTIAEVYSRASTYIRKALIDAGRIDQVDVAIQGFRRGQKFEDFAKKYGLEPTDDLYKEIKKVWDYVADLRLKNGREQRKQWSELLNDYGTYEYRRNKISIDFWKKRVNTIQSMFGAEKGDEAQSAYQILSDPTKSEEERLAARYELLRIVNDLSEVNEQFRSIMYSFSADEQKELSSIDEWSKLLDRYGDLRVKIIGVVRDASEEMFKTIQRFANPEEASEALNILTLIKMEDDEVEIRRLQEELRKILNKVVNGNLKKDLTPIVTAIDNRQLRETAKAYWDDFKDSDLYAATFDEMANISTQAIEAILSELDKLKDKVKEDPASMKALMKAYNDAQEELIRRKPFESIITSLNEWRSAVEGVKVAQQELDDAIIERTAAQQHLTEVQLARQNEERQGRVSLETHEREVNAMREFEKANKKVTASTVNLRTAESNATAARQRFINSIEASGQALENVSSLLKQFTELLGIAEDSELGMMVEGLSKGFSTMATVLSVVASVAAVAQMSLGWVAVVAAGLSVLVGLVSFLSSRKDTKITKQIEESERAVKRLENSYKNLEYAVEQAYGAVEIGAKKATVANKELQLAELKRQLALEKSRDSKHKDQNKILDLQGQIIDLEHEIAKASQDIVNDLLDISSVGDFAESLVSEMISAFREGEDYMEKFRDSFSDMIQNMIMKAIVGKVIGMRMQALFNELDAMIDNATKDEAAELVNAQNTATWAKDASDDAIKEALRKMDENQRRILLRRLGYTDDYITAMENTHDTAYLKYSRELLRRVREYLSSTQIEEAQKNLNQATEEVYPQLIDYVFGKIPELTQSVDEEFAAAMEKYGDYFNFSETNKELSALQQGIQGITEETAGALEAYMNGVSQQVYLQSDLLRQINTTIQSFDMDVQLANNAQMLLQLQQSYAVQVAIQTTLENWNSSNGRAVRVELVS